MGAFASVVRGALAGANQAAGNTQVASDLTAANDRARQARDAKLRAQVIPHAVAIKGLQVKLQGLDPQKDAAEYAAVTHDIARNLAEVRGILHPDHDPSGNFFERGITDKLHLTSLKQREQKEAANRGKGSAQDESEAQALAQGSPSYTETPQYKQAVDLMAKQTEGQIRVAEARLSSAGWTKSGIPVLVDDGSGSKQWMQPFVNKMGENMMQPMPPGYVGPNKSPIKGPLVRSSQSPTGWAQTYIDPANANHISAWQAAEPPRWGAGTQRTSTTTDPFGVTSTTSAQTTPMLQGDVDLSGAMALPASPEASQPSTPSSGTKTSQSATSSPLPKTKQLQSTRQTQTEGPQQLDANGHIPANAANPQLVQAANSILDGMDVDKLPLPARDKTAAMALASQYGFKGQGLFTPRETLQLKEGANVIQQMLDSKALDVLDQGMISQLPMIGQGADPSKEGFFGRMGTKLASSVASPDQQEFLRQWRQLDALAVGLRGLVQTGRATQAQVDRIIAELPNPYNTTSSSDARERLKRVQNELQVAAQSGKLTDVPTGESQKAIVQHSPSTGKYRYSTDGGKNWHPGQPPQ